MNNLPHEVLITGGMHANENGKVIDSMSSGHGEFYKIRFFNAQGELTEPPLLDLVNSKFCKVVVQ